MTQPKQGSRRLFTWFMMLLLSDLWSSTLHRTIVLEKYGHKNCELKRLTSMLDLWLPKYMKNGSLKNLNGKNDR